MNRIRRIAWSSFDQGLSSISNLVLSVLAARQADLEAFGAFGVAFAIYQFGLGSSRALIGEPALIRVSSDNPNAASNARGILGSAMYIGVFGSAVNIVAAIAAPRFSTIFLVFALGFPILMAVDSARYWYLAKSEARSAATIDGIWIVAQLSTYALFLWGGVFSIETVLVTWVIGAIAALLSFCIVRRDYPSLSGGYHWLRSVRHLSLRFWGEYIAISGVQQGVIYFSVIFAGIAAAGSLRGGQVIVGPLSMLTMGVAVVALPSLAARAREYDSRGLIKRSLAISGLLAATTLVYGTLILFLPPAVGENLLGDSWSSGIALVPFLIIQLIVSNLAYGATAGLRAMEAAKISLTLRLTTVPIVLLLVIFGASHSVSGAVIGATFGAALQLIMWWIAYLILARRLSRGQNDQV